MANIIKKLVNIPIDSTTLEGFLAVPENAKGIVIFAHGSGSSRHSPRNNFVAEVLQKAGLATLLTDLLTKEEDLDYEKRFDIKLISERTMAVCNWCKNDSILKNLNIGLFGASTGAAAALNAAAVLSEDIKAVVSRGGRPDLSLPNLHRVKTSVLLIVGSEDHEVIRLNKIAFENLISEKELVLIPNATHLFEEEGTLEQAAQKAKEWFKKYLINKN